MLVVRSIPGGQAKLLLDGGCCDERVGKTDAAVPSYSPGSFRHGTVDRHLSERSQERAHQVGGGSACEELSSGYDRVVHAVVGRSKLPSAA